MQDKAINNRLFLPSHIGEEFLRNRAKIIFYYVANLRKLVDLCDKCISPFQKQIDSSFREGDPYIKDLSLSNLSSAVEELKGKYITSLKKAEVAWDNINDDDVIETIAEIFEGKTSPRLSNDELTEMEKRAKQRYDRKIPPGYCDSNKDSNNSGDFILWEQIIKNCTDEKASDDSFPGAIFVTNDNKKDWWHRTNGKTFGVLPTLRREFFERTKCHIIIVKEKYFYENILKYCEGVDLKQDEINKELGSIDSYWMGFKFAQAAAEQFKRYRDIIPCGDSLKQAKILARNFSENKEALKAFNNYMVSEQHFKQVHKDTGRKKITVDDIVVWFFENYKDPSDGVPYVSKEGGYQYFNGGPYDAKEVLIEQYPLVSEFIINEALNIINSAGGPDWVGVEDY